MFVEVDEFVTDTHVNFDEEDIWSILFCVMGACVWTNNGNVREAKKGKEKRKGSTNGNVTRGEHWKKNKDGLS